MGEWDSVASASRDVKVSFMAPRELINRVRALAKERGYPMDAIMRDGLRLILNREGK